MRRFTANAGEGRRFRRQQRRQPKPGCIPAVAHSGVFYDDVELVEVPSEAERDFEARRIDQRERMERAFGPGFFTELE